MTSLREYLAVEVTKGKGNYYSRLLQVALFGAGSRCLLIYRTGKWLYDRGHIRIARLLFLKLQRQYGIYIHPDAVIGIGVEFPHPACIVIGQGVIIGKNVVIYQSTTFGGARRGDYFSGRYPEVGDGSVIFSGAALIGGIKLGRDCTVGANAVVNKSAPDFSTLVGAPARCKSE